MNELDELRELLAATRAVLEDATVRGAWVDPEGEPVAAQAAIPAPPEPEPAAAAAGWFALAAEAREAGAPPSKRLEAVRDEIGDCRRCNLCRDRRSIVFGVGDPEADLVVVGEAPGYEEDQRGEPFVGPAGQMLDKMLENVLGLKREQVYILNVVKCRPPKNRNPLPDEVEACRPFLEAQLRAIEPKVLLVLGSVAFKTLFRTDDGITRNRGRWREYEGIPALPTFHPAYLLRTPDDKRLTFQDLKELRARYDALQGRR